MYEFYDKKLEEQCTTHKSFDQDNHYQILEFLGDRVIKMTQTEQLCVSASTKDTEGDLSKKLSTMENNRWFSVLCKRMGLHKKLRVGKVGSNKESKTYDKMCSDILEAYFGAIYLDQLRVHGKGRAYEVASNLFLSVQDKYGESLEQEFPNPIGTLQELQQNKTMELPEYKVERIGGKDNNPVFCCECISIFGRASANGSSKRIAKENAARKICNLIS